MELITARVAVEESDAPDKPLEVGLAGSKGIDSSFLPLSVLLLKHADFFLICLVM